MDMFFRPVIIFVAFICALPDFFHIFIVARCPKLYIAEANFEQKDYLMFYRVQLLNQLLPIRSSAQFLLLHIQSILQLPLLNVIFCFGGLCFQDDFEF